MTDIRFVSISQWPGKQTSGRDKAPFRAPYSATIDLLDKELFQLSAKDVVIQAYFDARDIRNDGWPRSSARPSQPGIILSFTRRSIWNAVKQRYDVDQFSFPCDTFDSWEDNLRAIALALEALRKIDRYGVTRSGEQYKGFAQLPAPSESNGRMSETEARTFIRTWGGMNGETVDAYRRAAAILHPDNRQTGNHELFLKLQKAKEVLGA